MQISTQLGICICKQLSFMLIVYKHKYIVHMKILMCINLQAFVSSQQGHIFKCAWTGNLSTGACYPEQH